jgi:hypothetical protein
MLAGPSLGGSDASRQIQEHLLTLRRPPASLEGATEMPPPVSIAEKLFDSRAQFKVLTSQIAMHIDAAWRAQLFRQLDSLLDSEEWPGDEVPPTIGSYRTLIRLLLLLKPSIKPGFGASHDGHIIAAWTTGRNVLTVECFPRDQIQWSLVRIRESGEQPERAVGKNKIERLSEILAPYRPEIWFGDGEKDGSTHSGT